MERIRRAAPTADDLELIANARAIEVEIEKLADRLDDVWAELLVVRNLSPRGIARFAGVTEVALRKRAHRLAEKFSYARAA